MNVWISFYTFVQISSTGTNDLQMHLKYEELFTRSPTAQSKYQGKGDIPIEISSYCQSDPVL